MNVDQMLGYLRSLPGIDSVQLRLSRDGDTPRSARHLTIDYIGYAPVDIRVSLLKTFFHLKVIDDSYPDAIIIRECDKLARIERTNKIPNIVWE